MTMMAVADTAKFTLERLRPCISVRANQSIVFPLGASTYG
jgi:hypothetical protein